MRHLEGSPWVRRLHPAPAARCRVVCFPHAGGAASYFDPLAKLLSQLPGSLSSGPGSLLSGPGPAPGPVDVVDVLAMQPPGRQERLSERCIDNIEDLRDAIVPELLGGWLDRRFALFGHSMGAIVAYEVARVLEHEHEVVPIGVFVSGRRAPSTWRDEHVHRGGDAALLREVVRLGGTPQQLLDDEEVRQMMLPALRGDYKAIETYAWQPGLPLSCPIWALVGEADPLTTEREAAAWAARTTGGFELRTFPGAHFYLAAHLAELGEIVSAKLTS